jgi:ABC-type glycerol-3-phosphate transport system substrate-binding protein
MVKNGVRKGLSRFTPFGVAMTVILALCLLAALPVFAVKKVKAPKGEIPTVRVFSWSQGFVWPELFGKTGVDETDRLKAFEQKEGINVEVEWGDELTLRQKLALDLMSETGRYDIINVDAYIGVNVYGPTGYAEQLNKYIEKYPTEYFDISDIYPKTLETTKIGGILYGLPYYFNGPGMIYRSDIFENYGLKVPKTIDELYRVLEALKQGLEEDGLTNMTPVTMRAAPTVGTSIDCVGFVFAYAGYPAWFEGGPLTADQIRKTKAKPIFNGDFAPGFKAYCDIVQKYAPKGAATHEWADMFNIYAQGTAVIQMPATINGFAGWAVSQNEDVVKYTKFAQAPKGPSGKAIENYWTMSFGISKYSKNKMAAWKVLTLLTSRDAAMAFAEQTKWPCVVRKSALFSKPLLDKYGMDQLKEIEKMYVEGNPYFYPSFPEIGEFAEKIGTYVSKVVAGEMNSDTAVNSLQAWALEKMLSYGYYK